MTVHAFLARAFDTTHENEVFDAFVKRVDVRWAETDEVVVVIGNAIWNGASPDAVVLRQKAITVIDFKNFGGLIEITENGPWMCKGTPVKGGSKANPLVQVTDNKRPMKDWFEELPSEGRQNFWRGIFGLIVFHRPIELKGQMAPMTDRWFRITDLDHAVDTLSNFAANDLNLSHATLLNIPERLGVGTYTRMGSSPRIEALGGSAGSRETIDPLPLTLSQREALLSLERFLSDDTKSAFRILGMTSTGKSTLCPEIEQRVQNLGRQVVWLAPNNRIAALLSHPAEWKSIYTHLYSPSTKKETVDEDANEKDTKKRKRRIRVHPFSECKDAPDCVYVIDEAQLLSNGHFEREGERFGTGRLWDDFLSFNGLPGSRRKIILIGDPYQLTRGGFPDMPIHGEPLASKELSEDAYELDRVIIMEERSVMIRNAKAMVEAIQNQRFNHLDLAFDEKTFHRPPRATALELVKARFREDIQSHQVVVFANKVATALNEAIREDLWKPAGVPLVPGDQVELYSPIRTGNELDGFTYYGAGILGTAITASSAFHSDQMPLMGRENQAPTQWRVGEVNLDLHGGSAHLQNIPYLLEFLLAEKPELEADLVIALNAKFRPEEEDGTPPTQRPPARLRYAYAITCHHAQGAKKPRVLVNTETGQGRCSEDYFRWLYTAITRAEQEVVLLNFKPLTPLANAYWSSSVARIVQDIKGSLTLQVDPTAKPGPEDLAREQPEWSVPEPTLGQLWFWLELTKCLEPHGWKVPKVTSHAYQEQYDLLGPNQETCTLALTYNKENAITGIRPIRGTDTATPLAIIGERKGLVNLREPKLLAALQEIRCRLELGGWVIEEVKETNLLLSMRVANAAKGKVRLDVHSDGDGMVSSLRAVEATNQEAVGLLRGLLIDPEEPTHG